MSEGVAARWYARPAEAEMEAVAFALARHALRYLDLEKRLWRCELAEYEHLLAEQRQIKGYMMSLALGTWPGDWFAALDQAILVLERANVRRALAGREVV